MTVGQCVRTRLSYLAGALVAAALVLAGGDVMSSDLLQPAKNTRSGTSIRIFFMCFILYLIAAPSVASVRAASSHDNAWFFHAKYQLPKAATD